VRRILQAKAKLGLDKTRLVDINALNKKFGHTRAGRSARIFPIVA